MKKSRYRRGAAFLLSCLLAVSTCFAGGLSPFGMVSYADERSATVNATNLNVRSGPGTTYQSVGKLSHGTAVTVIGEQTAADGVLWYQIRFTGSGGAQTTGYVSSQYVRFPTAIANDGDFEAYMNQQGFPESYKPGLRELHAMYPQWTFTALQTNLDWNIVIQNESVVGRNLVSRDSISSWKSTAVGAYNWDTGTWPGFDGNSWVQASEDIIRYYMDPRNFLNDKYVFQFLKQTYDSSLQTREGLQTMVTGTFLAGTAASGGAASGGSAPGGGFGSGTGGGGMGNGGAGGGSVGPGGTTGPGASGPGSGTDNGGSTVISPISPVASISSHQVDLVTTAYGPGMNSSSGSGGSSPGSPGGGTGGGTAPASGSSSYIDIIMNAAVQSGVSPYILASMILQEQGSQGTGRSISGTVSGYEGYYNFFNIEAYQSGSMGAVERGLWWAAQSGSYERPWNSVERSILGGAIYYGSNYVKQGQNTLYLKKFNVQGNNLYKHQYMTNVLAAAAEGLTLAKVDALKRTSLEFSIPVYKNMPASACSKPTLDGSPNNKLAGLGVDGFALTPTFNRDTESYDLIVDASVASVTVEAAAIDSTAVVAGTGNVNLQSGNNEITVAVKAGNGMIRNYVIHVVRQAGGPTYSQSIGSGVTQGSGSFGVGPGGSSGPGGGSLFPGSANAPGSSTGGNSSGTDSNVEIIGPPGTGGGSSGSTGILAPDGSNMNSYGTVSDSAILEGPGGITVNGAGSAAGNGGAPGNSGAAGNPGASGNSGGAGIPGASGTSGAPGNSGAAGNPGTSGTSGSLINTGAAQAGTQVIRAETEASKLIASLQPSLGGGQIKVVNSSGAENTGFVGTGNLVQVYGTNGTPAATYEMVVKGDNNGDGRLNVLDILRAQRHILGLETLSGVYNTASDVNNNGKIDIMDVLAMQQDVLGIRKLN